MPALYLGAITRQEKVSHVLQAVSGRAFRGSSLMDNGVHGGMRILLPAMPFSSSEYVPCCISLPGKKNSADSRGKKRRASSFCLCQGTFRRFPLYREGGLLYWEELFW